MFIFPSDYRSPSINELQVNNLKKLRFFINKSLKIRNLNPETMWGRAWYFLRCIIHLNDYDIKYIELHAGFLNEGSGIEYWRQDPLSNPLNSLEVVQYKLYTKGLDEELWIHCPIIKDAPHQNDINLNGKYINKNIVRYQSAICNLQEMGVLRKTKLDH